MLTRNHEPLAQRAVVLQLSYHVLQAVLVDQVPAGKLDGAEDGFLEALHADWAVARLGRADMLFEKRSVHALAAPIAMLRKFIEANHANSAFLAVPRGLRLLAHVAHELALLANIHTENVIAVDACKFTKFLRFLAFHTFNSIGIKPRKFMVFHFVMT